MKKVSLPQDHLFYSYHIWPKSTWHDIVHFSNFPYLVHLHLFIHEVFPKWVGKSLVLTYERFSRNKALVCSHRDACSGGSNGPWSEKTWLWCMQKKKLISELYHDFWWVCYLLFLSWQTVQAWIVQAYTQSDQRICFLLILSLIFNIASCKISFF